MTEIIAWVVIVAIGLCILNNPYGIYSVINKILIKREQKFSNQLKSFKPNNIKST